MPSGPKDGVNPNATGLSQIGALPNKIAMEGHKDSKPYSGGNYGNWELSSDRANAARRLMQVAGLQENQITQLRGFADQQLRIKDDSLDPNNRRISLIVQYLDMKRAAEPEKSVKIEGGRAKGGLAPGEDEKEAGHYTLLFTWGQGAVVTAVEAARRISSLLRERLFGKIRFER